MSATKIGRNTTNILHCYFSKKFYSSASDEITTCGKLNFLSINRIYLVFSSLEMQRRFMQTKWYYKLFYYVWTETSHKTLKVAAAKYSFLSVYTTDTTCFDDCFLFYVITEKHYLNINVIVTKRFGTIATLLRSLRKMSWKKSAFHIHYLHNNIYNAADNKDVK